MKINNLPTIAIPKGRLYKQLDDLIFEKSNHTIRLPFTDCNRSYFVPGFMGDCNLFLAKPKAIPALIYSKFCEFGITGFDLMNNTDFTNKIFEIKDLGLNKVSMVLASKDTELKSDSPLIVATEFEIVANKYFNKLGHPYYILPTYGSTEGYTDLGADCIIDVCESGKTLKDNGLTIRDTLFKSSTRIFGHVELSECDLPNLIKLLL